MQIVVASHNAHKIDEIKSKLKEFNSLEVLSLDSLSNAPDDIVEDGATFTENALIKAKAIAKLTNSLVIADDSGLVIEALNGEPGIYSARYGNLKSDHEKNELVLKKLKNIPWAERKAKFVCVIAIITPDKEEITVKGECHGYITTEISGEHGFGYDPIFYVPEYDKTFAEIPLAEKNKISHRAIALENFIINLKKIIN